MQSSLPLQIHVVVCCTYTCARVVCMSLASSICYKWIPLDGVTRCNDFIKKTTKKRNVYWILWLKRNNWCAALQRCKKWAATTHLLYRFEALVAFANSHGLASVQRIDHVSNFVALQNMISLSSRRKQPRRFSVAIASNIAGRNLVNRYWRGYCSDWKRSWGCICSRVNATSAEQVWKLALTQTSRGGAGTCISAYFLAEIPLRSPRKLFVFII